MSEGDRFLLKLWAVALLIILLMLVGVAYGRTVTLTASEPLQAVPELHCVVEGATTELVMWGDVPGAVFTAMLPQLEPGQCYTFWIPPCGLRDLAGNCGDQIVSGTTYCAPTPQPTATAGPPPPSTPTPTGGGWVYPLDGTIHPSGTNLIAQYQNDHPQNGDGFYLFFWNGASYQFYDPGGWGAPCMGLCEHSFGALPDNWYILQYRYTTSGDSDYVSFQVGIPPSPTPTNTPVDTPTATPTVTPTIDAVKPQAALEVVE